MDCYVYLERVFRSKTLRMVMVSHLILMIEDFQWKGLRLLQLKWFEKGIKPSALIRFAFGFLLIKFIQQLLDVSEKVMQRSQLRNLIIN